MLIHVKAILLDSGACPLSWLPPAYSLRWRLFVRKTEGHIVSLAADLMSVAAKCQQLRGYD